MSRKSKTRAVILSWKERLNRDKKKRSKVKLCKGTLKRRSGLHVSRIYSNLVEDFVKMDVYVLNGGGVVSHGSFESGETHMQRLHGTAERLTGDWAWVF